MVTSASERHTSRWGISLAADMWGRGWCSVPAACPTQLAMLFPWFREPLGGHGSQNPLAEETKGHEQFPHFTLSPGQTLPRALDLRPKEAKCPANNSSPSAGRAKVLGGKVMLSTLAKFAKQDSSTALVP